MVELLRQIKDRIPEDNPFLGDAEVRQLRSLQVLSPPKVASDRFRLASTVGGLEMRLGNTEAAIKSLETALDIALSAGDQVPPSVVEDMTFRIGVAYQRLGENENCVDAHTSDSCIFPIRDKGVHQNKRGSTKAIEYFARVLKKNPDHLKSRWLLNIAFMTIGGYPDDVPPDFLIPPQAFESEEDFPRFVDRAAGLGLDTFSYAGGSVVDDFDADGYLDIFVSSWSPAGQLRYFHNDGDGTFSDRTDDVGLLGIFGGLNLVHADYDNDGDLDILVLRGGWLGEAGRHPNSLLRNDGNDRFTDVTFDAGLGRVHYPSQTAAWADYDNDGDLDLYIGNEEFPNQLFHNRGDGTFVDVAQAAGVADESFTKGVGWGDYDGDRLPDLYVSNMDGANRLYHNEGGGKFTDVAAQHGVSGPRFSFPLWFWDYNNDGHLDLFVASFWQDVAAVAAGYLDQPHQSEMDHLYQGDGKGGFRDVAAEQNLRRVTQPMGSNFGDLDNDGYLDFYLGTGYPAFEALVPNLMFRNDRGRGFVDVTSAGGFGHLQKGHGVAFADLDNDGDQDIFHEVGGWYAGDGYTDALFENPGFGHHWIAIRLVGTQSNTAAIGARIRLDIEDASEERSIYRWVNSGGSFGGNPFRQQIGLGKSEKIRRLEIYWPTSGQTQTFEDVGVDQFIQITEGEQEFAKLPWKTVKLQSTHFHNGHTHH